MIIRRRKLGRARNQLEAALDIEILGSKAARDFQPVPPIKELKDASVLRRSLS